MYKIIGSDGRQYGPISMEQVRQWIAEGRADGRTMVQAEGTTAWRPLSEFPEFAAAPAAGPRAPVAGAPAPVQTPLPAGPAKTSGMAIASMVLSLFGLCGLLALVALVLGIVAQVKISKSNGQLKGSGFAIAGIVLSALLLLMQPALLLPALAKAKNRAEAINCMNQMRQLALGLRMYASDNKDTLPPANTWCDSIQGYVPQTRSFQCKADRTGQRSSYALNKKVAGRNLAKVDPQTVLIFEVEGGAGWNESGSGELIMHRSRHGHIAVVGFADSSVRQMRPEQVSTLRWDP